MFVHFHSAQGKKAGLNRKEHQHSFIHTNPKNANHQACPYYWKNITRSQIHQYFSSASNLIPSHNRLTHSPFLPSLPIMTFSCRSSSTVLTTVFLNTMHELVICWGRCSGFDSVVLYWSFNKASWLFPGAYPILLFFVHLLQTSCILWPQHIRDLPLLWYPLAPGRE